MFLAEVLAVQIDEQYLNEKNKFELNKTGLMAYSHGEYLSLGKKIGTFGYSVKRKRRNIRKRKIRKRTSPWKQSMKTFEFCGDVLFSHCFPKSIL